MTITPDAWPTQHDFLGREYYMKNEPIRITPTPGTPSLQDMSRMLDTAAGLISTVAQAAADLPGSTPNTNGRPEKLRDISSAIRSARHILQVQQKRNARFGEPVGTGKATFGDPAWSMLLDLYVSAMSGKRTSVSSLCIASGVPPTTALRHISTMVSKGWILRVADPKDARRIFLELSTFTIQAIESTLA
ncbi:MAG TPA: hypothetical protein VF463_15470 [Sphingobium sp.]